MTYSLFKEEITVHYCFQRNNTTLREAGLDWENLCSQWKHEYIVKYGKQVK